MGLYALVVRRLLKLRHDLIELTDIVAEDDKDVWLSAGRSRGLLLRLGKRCAVTCGDR